MNVLLAVDGSDSSHEAARALAHLARPDKLVVLHVSDVPAPMYPSVVPEVAREIQDTITKTLREEGERLLHRITSVLPPNIGPVKKRLEIGNPTTAILDVAAQEDAHLILMGSRGVGQVRELTLGSVSHRVASHARCPVLVVGAPVRALRHVLLTVETPEDADVAVTYLKARPFCETPEVTVLTVIPYVTPAWPVGTMIPEAYRKDLVRQAGEFVIGIASQLATAGYRAKGEAVLGAPAVEILREASKRRVDLIMVGSPSKGVTRLFLGSVSHSVLHKASCSVLAVRSPIGKAPAQ